MNAVDLEQAAEESERDRKDHRALAQSVEDLLKHEDAMRVPMATRRLVDLGVDPIVVAKTLLIGDRDGGFGYRMSAATGLTSVSVHEVLAEQWIGTAIRDMDPDLAATTMIAGAVWLAIQCGVDRVIMTAMIRHADRRGARETRRGYGVVDLVDSHGVGDRDQLVKSIELAQLPMFAPLIGSPFKGTGQ